DQQAHAAVHEMGVADSAAFFKWAWATQPHQLKGAHLRHFQGRLDGYRQLVRTYMSAKGIQTGAAVGQGNVTVVGARTVGGKNVITVRTGTGKTIEVSEANARQQGWL